MAAIYTATVREVVKDMSTDCHWYMKNILWSNTNCYYRISSKFLWLIFVFVWLHFFKNCEKKPPVLYRRVQPPFLERKMKSSDHLNPINTDAWQEALVERPNKEVLPNMSSSITQSAVHGRTKFSNDYMASCFLPAIIVTQMWKGVSVGWLLYTGGISKIYLLWSLTGFVVYHAAIIKNSFVLCMFTFARFCDAHLSKLLSMNWRRWTSKFFMAFVIVEFPWP